MIESVPRAPRSARYALAVIFSANFLSYLDRQLVSALEEPIRRDVGLTSAEFGLLWTLFTLGYMACSPFIGYASDRLRRPLLFAACIVVWSLATLASGWAPTKGVLYVSRVLIGLGEAGCLIVGSALISDYFPRDSRGRALSVFYLGLPIGGTAAFILAGIFLKLELGWRTLFYAAGLPGFVVALLIALLADPPRGATDPAGDPHAPVRGGGVREYLRLFRTPTLLWIVLAQAFAVIILVPLIHFGVEFFVQERGMEKGRARIALGVIALIAGGLGNTFSGVIGDRLARRFRGAYAAMAGVSFLLALPSLLVGFLAPRPAVFLPVLTLGAFFIFLCMPAVNTQIANVTHPTQRAMAWALAVFVLHLLGDTLAPPVFGLVDHSLGRLQAFLIFSAALVPASLCCFLAARTSARDETRAATLVPQGV
ncbi:MAG TPA: MFS transporter [Planctomycetota bacterium]|nr:MFS transporter [Planctomycetota bacterium]